MNARAIEKLRALKGREETKPILVIVSDAAESERFIAQRTDAFATLAASHWPGALTLVAQAREEVPTLLTASTGTIGVRLPADNAVRDLVRECGGALTATSANPSTCPPARTAVEVENYFSDMLVLIVDGGSSAASTQPSTVVDVSGEVVQLIRAGAVGWDELQITLKTCRQ